MKQVEQSLFKVEKLITHLLTAGEETIIRIRVGLILQETAMFNRVIAAATAEMRNSGLVSRIIPTREYLVMETPAM
jgi:hypothetical protein